MENRQVVALGGGCGVGEMDERDQEVQASSYITYKSRGC